MRELRVLAGVAIALALARPAGAPRIRCRAICAICASACRSASCRRWATSVSPAATTAASRARRWRAGPSSIDARQTPRACARSPSSIDDSLAARAALGDKLGGHQGRRPPGDPLAPDRRQGVVQGLRIVTDPEARLYLKKKAFLLPIRVMGRYGRDGWDCIDAQPGEGRPPVGGMFIDRHCEKTFHDRRLVLETDLYRTAGQSGQEFTDADPARDHQRRCWLIGRITASRPVAPDPGRRPSPRSRCPAGAGGRPNRTRPGCASGCPDRGSWRRSRSRRRRRRWCGSTG